MSIMSAKFLYRPGPKILNLVTHNVFRRSSNQKDPCYQSTPTPTSSCPDPPPCPPMPQCPPSLCNPPPDPNDPCNYCPPPCIDPDAPDITKLKQMQCKFQAYPDIPVYLKGGNFDVFLYQLTLVLNLALFPFTCYLFTKML